jgi:[ribosomal protein S5]-alanine N-acetyltransferase
VSERQVEVTIRPLRADDAAAMARLYRENRAFLAPYEPVREDAFYTERGQRELWDANEGRRAAGLDFLFVIEADGEPVGRVNLNNVVRGVFGSANLGYFVSQPWNGHGIAGRAIGAAVRCGFEELDLHRVEAGTLLDNVRSQHVLLRNDFRLYGIARRYLKIAGRWQDHALFQRTVDQDPADEPPEAALQALRAQLERRPVQG